MTNPTNANPKILLEIEPVMTVLEDNDNQLDTQINEDIGVNSEIPINVDTPEIIDIPKCFDTPKHTEKENIQMKILDLCSKLYEIDRKNQEPQKKKDCTKVPDFIKTYEENPNKSKQYLKNLKSILKLDGMNKEILYECITKKDNSIYKLLFILSKQETISIII